MQAGAESGDYRKKKLKTGGQTKQGGGSGHENTWPEERMEVLRFRGGERAGVITTSCSSWCLDCS